MRLALTQPSRLYVVVKNGFRRVEEIQSAYVVVLLWDVRRVVVSLTYCINTLFENWMRRTANLIGEVSVFADYDIGAAREELPQVIARTPLWGVKVQASR